MECERDRIVVLFTVSRVGLEKCAVTLEDARRFVREKLISYMKLVISYARSEQRKDERRVEVVSNHNHPHLVDVAELRVSVSEILNLSSGSIGQTVIALAHVALSVLPLAVKDTKSGQE
jgi:hypothetical protein